jgi:uncharacterized membrane protein
MVQGKAPAKAWYGVAAALALAGCVAGGAIIWVAVFALSAPQAFVVPGSFAFEADKPGRYALWHDYTTQFRGEVFAVNPRLPSGAQIRIVGPRGQVEVRGVNSQSTSKIGGTERAQVSVFDAPAAGRYEIAVQGSFPRRVLSVGPDNLLRTIALMFGGIGSVLLGLLAGGALAAWAYFRREALAARQQSEGAEMETETPAQSSAGSTHHGSETTHSLKQLTQLVYALQAASFLVGITCIAAVIVNYVKKEDVAGTLFESHFRWQIRTFWWSLLWGVIGVLLMVVVVGFFILAADALWFLYRVIKGWLRLSEGKPM